MIRDPRQCGLHLSDWLDPADCIDQSVKCIGVLTCGQPSPMPRWNLHGCVTSTCNSLHLMYLHLHNQSSIVHSIPVLVQEHVQSCSGSCTRSVTRWHPMLCVCGEGCTAMHVGTEGILLLRDTLEACSTGLTFHIIWSHFLCPRYHRKSHRPHQVPRYHLYSCRRRDPRHF